MMKRVAAVFVFVAGLLVAHNVSAQTLQWTDRAFLNASGGIQTGSKTVTSTLSFPLYDETATIESSRKVESSPIWDVTGGLRVWNNFAVAVSVSGRKADSDGTTTASIPHPIFFDQARLVSGNVSGIKHSELWTSLLVGWMYPVTDKFEVMLMAGPTVASVKHEIVTSATVAEGSTPVVTVKLETLSKSPWGLMAGVDGRYMITKRIGAGAFVRYASAKANLNTTTKLDLGGLQVGGGVRVRF
ncbi:MAG: hypothetical protein ABIP90_00700 [Vicinamibacterales bacterium]